MHKLKEIPYVDNAGCPVLVPSPAHTNSIHHSYFPRSPLPVFLRACPIVSTSTSSCAAVLTLGGLPGRLIGLGLLLLTNVSAIPESPAWSTIGCAGKLGHIVCNGLGERIVESNKSACSAWTISEKEIKDKRRLSPAKPGPREWHEWEVDGGIVSSAPSPNKIMAGFSR